MKRIAIIPARGGSKRIPRKNILEINSLPMIAWTIKAALDSKCFSQVFVATDDQEIASIAAKFGASVPFLRDRTDSDDHTPISTATVNFLTRSNIPTTEVVQLMANCPCRTAVDIIKAVKEFETSESNFQISAFQFGWINPWWSHMKCRDKEDHFVALFPDAIKKRSQDLDPLFCPTGAIWIARTESLLAEGTFYGSNYRLSELDWTSAVDIDDWSDFRMAELVFRQRHQYNIENHFHGTIQVVEK